MWSLAQLHDWFRFLSPVLFREARNWGAVVHGVGVNSNHHMINVVVGDEHSRTAVESMLAGKQVPCRLVGTSIGGPLVPL